MPWVLGPSSQGRRIRQETDAVGLFRSVERAQTRQSLAINDPTRSRLIPSLSRLLLVRLESANDKEE